MKTTRTVIGTLALIAFLGGVAYIALTSSADTAMPTASVPESVTPQTTVPDTTDTGVRPALHDPSTLKPGSSGTTTTPKSTTPAPGTYTMAQVSSHNSASSCWSVIRGGVFDLTNWINRHPGGQQAILVICGVDGTSLFDSQHEGQGRPEQILASFKIGTLQ